MRAPGTRTLIIGGGVAAAVAGAILLWVVLPFSADYGYDQDDAVLEEWCSNLDRTPGETADSPELFVGVAERALAGELAEPGQSTATGDVDVDQSTSEDRWYAASVHLLQLRGHPDEVLFAAVVYREGLIEAHADEPLSHPEDLRRAAEALDSYRSEHCAAG